MSSSLLRRNSSKKLQNLQRITVQRSLEDAEEIERERRRRARGDSSAESPLPALTPQDHPLNAQCLETRNQNVLASNGSSCLDEDEGFGDWAQLSRRKEEANNSTNVETHLNGSQYSELQIFSSSVQQSKLQQKELDKHENSPFKEAQSPLLNQKNQRDGVHKEGGDKVQNKGRDVRHWYDEGSSGKMKSESSPCKKESQSCDVDNNREKKAEKKISYTSTILVQHKGRQNNEEKKKEEKINQSLSEEVSGKSNGGNRVWRNAADDSTEEVHRKMREEGRERKRRDVMEKMKKLSISSGDPEEPFSPLSPRSPSYMAQGEDCQSEASSSISERTESLNRSLKKRNSIKKIQPPMTISKLDGRREQYNHAVEECCKEGNTAKQPLVDVPTPPEPVSVRKALFEEGEAWAQTSVKTSKDTDGMKVGIADLINQWVKGTPDVNSHLSRASDVKAGEVRNIKSMWETIGDISSQPCIKGSSGKRYKFVESGHGKYEKVLVNND